MKHITTIAESGHELTVSRQKNAGVRGKHKGSKWVRFECNRCAASGRYWLDGSREFALIGQKEKMVKCGCLQSPGKPNIVDTTKDKTLILGTEKALAKDLFGWKRYFD